MIATGGTIASKEGDLGLTPAVTGEELAASVPGIKDICHLEILQLMNIDSTNMRPRAPLLPVRASHHTAGTRRISPSGMLSCIHDYVGSEQRIF